MIPLDDGPHVDHRVDIRIRDVYFESRIRRLGEKLAEPAEARARRTGIVRAGEGEQPPSAVRFDRVPEVDALGIPVTNDRRRVKARPSSKPRARCWCVGSR